MICWCVKFGIEYSFIRNNKKYYVWICAESVISHIALQGKIGIVLLF